MIKLHRRHILALILVLASLPSFAQKYSKGMIEKSVAVVGKDVIMLSEIEEECRMQRMRGLVTDMTTRCEILEGIMVNKLFYFQAQLDSLAVNDANVEAALNSRMDEAYSSLGGEATRSGRNGGRLSESSPSYRRCSAMSRARLRDLPLRMSKRITSRFPRRICR